MTLKNRVPPRLTGPIGLGSILVMIGGLTVGYILTILGITLYFGHGIAAPELVWWESLTISAIGLVLIAVGYYGWKGFTYFSY